MKTKMILPNPNSEKIAVSCNFFGLEDTSTNAMEECAELIQCIGKELRGKSEKDHMEEEIGDVLISISNLIYIYDLDYGRIQDWIDYKQDRQMDRIGK